MRNVPALLLLCICHAPPVSPATVMGIDNAGGLVPALRGLVCLQPVRRVLRLRLLTALPLL